MRVPLKLNVIVACMALSFGSTKAEQAPWKPDPFCKSVAAMYLVDESLSMHEHQIKIDLQVTPFGKISENFLIESISQAPRWNVQFGGFSLSLVGWSGRNDYRTKLSWVQMTPDMVEVGQRAARLFSYNQSGTWIETSLDQARPQLTNRPLSEVRIIILISDGDALWWGSASPLRIRETLDQERIELIPMVIDHPSRVRRNDDGSFEPSLASQSVIRELTAVSSLQRVIIGSDSAGLQHELEQDLTTLACGAF